MNEQTIQQIKTIILDSTFQRGFVDDMYGPALKEPRKQIMSMVLDKKATLAESGVNKLINAMIEISGIQTFTCRADLYKQLQVWVRS